MLEHYRAEKLRIFLLTAAGPLTMEERICQGVCINFHAFKYPIRSNKCTPFHPSPKHNSSTSLLTKHSNLCLTLVQHPTTRPSIWSVHGCPALISEDDIGEILFVIPVCLFYSFIFMFFDKKWPFEGVCTLPMDWITLQCVVFTTFGADAGSKMIFDFFLPSFSSYFKDLSENFFSVQPFRCFSCRFPSKNKCLICSVISAYYFGNFDGSFSDPKQGSYSGTVRII